MGWDLQLSRDPALPRALYLMNLVYQETLEQRGSLRHTFGFVTSRGLGRWSAENEKRVGGGVRIHPKNARMSGRHGVQYVAQCVAYVALTLVVRQ